MTTREHIIRTAQSVVAILLLLGVWAAFAAPPDPNTRGPLASWFEGLKQPGSGGSCCSIADCREAIDPHIADGTYWVRSPLSGEFLRVPPEFVLRTETNPTGRYIVCIYDNRVLCFVPAVGT